jgi:hypothetical protein
VGNNISANKYGSHSNAYDDQDRNANNHYTVGKQSNTDSPSTAYATTSSVKNQNSPASSSNYNSSSEVVMVNGSAVTEEMSARILQCLSQKSIENQQRNQQRYSQKQAAEADNYYNSSQQPETLRQQRFSSHASASPAKTEPVESQTITTFIDNIPLTSSRNDSRVEFEANKWNQTEHDEEMIGVEIRPQPVNTSDLKILSLHAVLQDHTYYTPAVTPPPPLPAPPPLTPSPQLPRSSNEMTVTTSGGLYPMGGGVINSKNSGSSTTLNLMTNEMMMSPGHSRYSYSKSQGE